MTHDVEGRLAQGRPVVDDLGEYVRACQHVGYSHPDLTTRPDQVHDWYATEDGMQLDALSADADALAAMSGAAERAARRQSELVTGLTPVWSGHGADSALDFLARNQSAAMTVATALRDAARTLTSLRDELWNAVDAKVSATLAVDVGRRSEWLAAARTVTGGAGDRSTAAELVDQQVKPFVHDVIGTQWVDSMRSHTAAVEAAYRTALVQLNASGGTLFEVPGQLGPRSPEMALTAESGGRAESVGASTPAPGASVPPAAVAPASFSAPAGPAVPVGSEIPAPQPLSTPGTAPASAAPLGDLGSFGSASPSSGLSGFGQQLSDLIGGLMGDATDEATDDAIDADSLDPDDADDGDDPEDDPEDDPMDDPGDDEAEATDDANAETGDGAAPADPAAVDPAAAEPEPPSPPPAATTVVEPAPAPAPPPPSGAEQIAPPPPEPTPCELAADELPQVGD